MQQWLTRFKHTVVDGKKVSKRQEIILCQAISYSDVETAIAKFIEKEGFVNATAPDISKFQAHELLCGINDKVVSLTESIESDMPWWKARIKYIAEEANGKINIFYARYLVYTDSLEKALKLIKEKEKGSAMPGELENITIAKIDYVRIPLGGEVK